MKVIDWSSKSPLNGHSRKICARTGNSRGRFRWGIRHSHPWRIEMADRTVLDEKLATLSAKVDDLVARAASAPQDTSQAEVDQTISKIDEILARIP